MSDTEELLTGRAGEEARQGWTPMPMAQPESDEPSPLTPEEFATDDSDAGRHLGRDRAIDFPPPIERAYHDVQTGERRPDNEILPSPEKAAADLSEIRAAERLEAERQHNADLNFALDQLRSEEETMRHAMEPQPAAVEQPVAEPQPDALQPQPEHTEVPGLHPEIAVALRSPAVRGMLEQVNQQFEQTRAQYAAATQQLATEAVAMLGAAAPELAGMNPQEAAGALRLIAQQNPQRAEAIRQLVGRTQNILAAHQQQQHHAQLAQLAEQQRQAQLQARWLQQYKIAEDLKWEEAVARDRSPEQIKALRENAVPLVERHYGIRPEQLHAIYSGEERVDGATFMRSAPFQMMLSDALSYRMSKEAVGRAVSRQIPNVQRPGSSGEAQTRTQAALAEAQAKLKPSMNPREAANYLIARRAAR
jgi:hypothetical protein